MSELTKRQVRWPVWIAVGVGLLVFYILGSGPVNWAVSRRWVPNQFNQPLIRLYQPLGWACSSNGTTRDLFAWYMQLYERKEIMCVFPMPPSP